MINMLEELVKKVEHMNNRWEILAGKIKIIKKSWNKILEIKINCNSHEKMALKDSSNLI